MTPPRCSRCGINAYQGEVRILMGHPKGDDNRTYSLCHYCLPLVRDRLIGFIEGNLLMEETKQ